MEFINALDYSVPAQPYEYIDSITLGDLILDKKTIADFEISSYGKANLKFIIAPGILEFINKVSSLDEVEINVIYRSEGSTFRVGCKCKYDHNTISSSYLELYFYHNGTIFTKLEEETTVKDAYVKSE